jgi:hypothetical protein
LVLISDKSTKQGDGANIEEVNFLHGAVIQQVLQVPCADKPCFINLPINNCYQYPIPDDGNCLLRSAIIGVMKVRQIDKDEFEINKLVVALRLKLGFMCLNEILNLEVDVESVNFCHQVKQILSNSTNEKTILQADLMSRLMEYNGGEYEKAESKSSSSSSSSSSSPLKWSKLRTHNYVTMFQFDARPERVYNYKDVLEIFEECFFEDGTWITCEFMKFIPDIFKVNIQIYVVNKNGNGFFFREQFGELYEDSVLLAFIPYSVTNSNRSTRGGERHTMTISKDANPNHFEPLFVDKSSIFQVTTDRGNMRGGAGFVGSTFTISGWLEIIENGKTKTESTGITKTESTNTDVFRRVSKGNK